MSSTIPSPHANSFVIGTGVINAHTLSSGEYYNRLTKSKGGIISSPAAPVRAPGPARAPCSHPQTGPPDSATSPVIVLYSRALCARLCVLALPPSPAGFLMSAHLSRLRLFQRHLRSLVWVGVWVWDWIHSHTPPRTRSPSSRREEGAPEPTSFVAALTHTNWHTGLAYSTLTGLVTLSGGPV